MVEDDQFGVVGCEGMLDLVELATADEGARVGTAPAALDQGRRHRTSGSHQFQEFTWIFAILLVLKVHMDQNRRFAGVGTFEKQSLPLDQLSSPGAALGSCGGNRTLREGTTVEMACL